MPVGQGINVGPGKFGKTNKHRATTIKQRNIHRAWKKIQKINKHRDFNKTLGHGKKSQSNKHREDADK